MSEADEIAPFVICRTGPEQMEFALWSLDGGRQALALFLTAEAAGAYLADAVPSEGWRAFCPTSEGLFEIFKQCRQSGVFHAVLDLGAGQEQRIFDLAEILRANGLLE